MIDRNLIQVVLDMIKAFDGQSDPEKQQEIERARHYLRTIKHEQFDCWSCQQSQSVLYGISLDDTETVHVCDSCWSKIPHAWRLIATKFFRTDPNDGAAQLLIAQVQQALKPGDN